MAPVSIDLVRVTGWIYMFKDKEDESVSGFVDLLRLPAKASFFTYQVVFEPYAFMEINAADALYCGL